MLELEKLLKRFKSFTTDPTTVGNPFLFSGRNFSSCLMDGKPWSNETYMNKLDESIEPHPDHAAQENDKLICMNELTDEINDEIIVYKGKFAADQNKSIFFTCNNVIPFSDLKEEIICSSLAGLGQFPRMISYRRKKLLVLDINGLLADIVMPAPKHRRGDIHILGRAIFKRPFCDDFLRFCFENFDVGIWSSRSKRIIDKIVDYLLGSSNMKEKLLFCWDMTHATQTGFETLKNIHKPLVLKELRKIWEKYDSVYDESNTLLLDDSSYKALLNPLHNAIFPRSFSYKDINDNSLGQGGDLRVYLEGLMISEDVRSYVAKHPFGQGAIDETNLCWEFYSRVLQTMTKRKD